MKIFITGGTGNIGQYVTLALAARGHECVVLSRTPEKYAPMLRMGAPGSISIVPGEITDYPLMARYVAGCDAVISIALGWGNEPVSMLMNDTAATVNLLELAEKAGVSKFLFTSSTAAMGHNRAGMDETFVNIPNNLYAATKGAIEAYVLGFSQYFGDGGAVAMKRNVIRPGYTFANPCFVGGKSQSDMRFADITNAVRENRPVHVTKYDGTQFLSAGQIAKLYVALLESDLNEEVFLALAADFTTWERVAQIALEEYPASTSEIVVEDKGWGAEPLLYGVGKMERVFGLKFTGEDEIRAHVRWNLEQ
ncbi:MAG: NAD(P)-dependent oxidoreductase [Defluviitaleaceae bacterium]|nr:NAD(P)-dependent oxidoreductase [Defluviitaleaceae bacterium]